MHYSREATANRVPGQPLVFTAPGRFVSAPVVENVEVAAATRSGGGHSGGDVSTQIANERRRESLEAGASNVRMVRSGW